jgi:hypothetical protein
MKDKTNAELIELVQLGLDTLRERAAGDEIATKIYRGAQFALAELSERVGPDDSFSVGQ